MSNEINTLDDAEKSALLTALAKLARARKAPDGSWLEFAVKFHLDEDGGVTAVNMQMCVLKEIDQSICLH